MKTLSEYNEGAYILSLLGGILIAIQSLLWGFGMGMMGGIGMMGGSGIFGPTMGSRWMYEIRRGEIKSGGTIALVIGVFSLLFGAWLGGLLASIAGIIALVE